MQPGDGTVTHIYLVWYPPVQALSIRPDLLSPAAMGELQKLCDKVPSFDSVIAMQVGTSHLVLFADLFLGESKTCFVPVPLGSWFIIDLLSRLSLYRL